MTCAKAGRCTNTLRRSSPTPPVSGKTRTGRSSSSGTNPRPARRLDERGRTPPSCGSSARIVQERRSRPLCVPMPTPPGHRKWCARPAAAFHTSPYGMKTGGICSATSSDFGAVGRISDLAASRERGLGFEALPLVGRRCAHAVSLIAGRIHSVSPVPSDGRLRLSPPVHRRRPGPRCDYRLASPIDASVSPSAAAFASTRYRA